MIAFLPSFIQFYEIHTKEDASASTSLRKSEDKAAADYDPDAPWIGNLEENEKELAFKVDWKALSPLMRCIVLLLRDIDRNTVSNNSRIVEITNFAKRMIGEHKKWKESQDARRLSRRSDALPT